MKRIYISNLIFFFFISNIIFSQEIIQDTTNANIYFKKAKNFLKTYKLDSSYYYTNLAQNIYLKNFGENSAENIKCIENYGAVFYYLSDLDSAIYFFKKSLAIKLNIYGINNIETANIYNNIGAVFEKFQQYDSCIVYYYKSIDLKTKILDSNNILLGHSYNNLGNLYCKLSQYQKSLYYLKKGLQIRILVNGEKNEYVANSYYSIGNLYKFINVDSSLKYLFKCVSIQKELNSENSVNVATTYFAIGNIYTIKKQYSLSLLYNFKASNIIKNILGENSNDYAEVLNSIGSVYYELNNKRKALEYYYKSLEIRNRNNFKISLSKALLLNNIGCCYHDLGEYQKALEFFWESLNIRQNVLNPSNYNIAQSFMNIGSCYFSLKDYEKSKKYFNECLRIRMEILGEKNPEIALVYNNLGLVSIYEKNYNLALNFYQKSIYSNLNFTQMKNNSYDVPKIRTYLGWSELAEAISKTTDILMDTNKILSNISNNKRLLLSLEYFKAVDTLLYETRIEQNNIDDKINIINKAHYIYSKAIELCYDLTKIKQNESQQGYYESLALYFSEQSKARILIDEITEKNAEKSAGIPDSIIEKKKDLVSKLNYYQNLIAETNDSLKIVNLMSKKFNTKVALDVFLEEINVKFPKYSQLSENSKTPNLNSIQSKLNSQTAIISYSLLDSLLMTIMITNQDIEIFKTILPPSFNFDLKMYFELLTNIDKANNNKLLTISYQLYNQLIPKTLQSKESITNLIIIPDDSLLLIPFETLLYQDNNGDVGTLKDSPFMIKKYTITYNSSITMWFNEPKINLQQDKRKEIALFAPIEFNKDTIIIQKTEDENLNTRGIVDEEYDKSLYYIGFFKPLESTKEETDAIYKMFGKKRAEKYQYRGASEYNFKKLILEDYKIIHIASHAFSSNKSHLMSGILFANDTTGKQDGFLRESEIYELKLNAELVVLSACQTAIGFVYKGEGIMSISRAFIYAGAKNIISTQWAIYDKTTTEIMKIFYKYYLSGNMTISQALQKAKLDFINKGDLYSHPKVWAPYVLIGH